MPETGFDDFGSDILVRAYKAVLGGFVDLYAGYCRLTGRYQEVFRPHE